MLQKLDRFHKSKPGLLIFGLAELLIADGFFSLSIDRGNFWWYILTLIFLIGALQNIIKFIGSFFKHGRKR